MSVIQKGVTPNREKLLEAISKIHLIRQSSLADKRPTKESHALPAVFIAGLSLNVIRIFEVASRLNTTKVFSECQINLHPHRSESKGGA